MKFPIIVRSRVNQEWRDECKDREIEHLQQVLKEKDEVIRQNAEVQESQRRHISGLDATIVDGRAHNKKLIELMQAQRDDVHLARAAVDTVRTRYEGDLMQERQRYDEFVREYLDKVLQPPATQPRAQSSSRSEPQLPVVIQQAIEDTAGGNEALARHLDREAWKRIRSDSSNAEDVAELIRRGESPEI